MLNRYHGKSRVTRGPGSALLIFVFSTLCLFSFSCLPGSPKEREESISVKKEPFRGAYALYDEGRYELAADYFEKALLIYPEEGAEHLTLAVIYDDNLRDKGRAAKHYEAYLKARPGEEKAELARQWFMEARRQIKSADAFIKDPANPVYESMIEEYSKTIAEQEKKIQNLEMIIKDQQAKMNGISNFIGSSGKEDKMVVGTKLADLEKNVRTFRDRILVLEEELESARNENERAQSSIRSLMAKIEPADKEKNEKKSTDQKKVQAVDKIDIYKVKKGESLRIIAGYDFIYGDGEKWRLIYDANKKNISKANILTPGQILVIPRKED